MLGHHKITCAFGGRFDQYRGLHLYESLSVEVTSHLLGHPVAEHHIDAYVRPAQIEITVFHPQLIASVGILFYCERRDFGRVEYRNASTMISMSPVGHFRIFIAAFGYGTR